VFALVLLRPGGLVAQVPVVQEPHHRVALENEYIRLIDVWIKPGDTTLYHVHQQPSAIVFLSTTFTGSQPLGGAPSSGQNYPGNTFFAPYDQKPITHRVWNQDTVVFHVMDIELLRSGQPDPCPLQTGPAVELAWEQKMAAIYRIHVGVGESLTIPSSFCAHLLILISGRAHAEVANHPSTKANYSTAGDLNFFPAQSGVVIINDGTKNAQFDLLALK
jgi:hypothetical protein